MKKRESPLIKALRSGKIGSVFPAKVTRKHVPNYPTATVPETKVRVNAYPEFYKELKSRLKFRKKFAKLAVSGCKDIHAIADVIRDRAPRVEPLHPSMSTVVEVHTSPCITCKYRLSKIGSKHELCVALRWAEGKWK